jgi:hypothetical protein
MGLQQIVFLRETDVSHLLNLLSPYSEPIHIEKQCVYLPDSGFEPGTYDA